MVAHLHLARVDMIVLSEERGGKLSGGNHRLAFRQGSQHAVKVSLLYDFQVFVRSGALGATDAQAGVKDGHATVTEEIFEFLQAVSLVVLVYEPQFVAKEAQTEDAPHVVGKVGVVPFHAPTLGCGWKGAQHQQLGILRKEWLKRMNFNHDEWRVMNE